LLVLEASEQDAQPEKLHELVEQLAYDVLIIR
jgi:hypothetical protein